MRLGIRLRAFAVAVAALTVAVPNFARAQEQPQAAATTIQGGGEGDPVLVVSITGFERLFKDLNYLGNAVGQGGSVGMLQGVASGFIQGIDQKRPMGVTVQMTDGAPAPLVFLPTTDLKRFLKTLEAQTGPADDLGDGTLAIALGQNLFYIRDAGKWAYVAQSPEMFEDLPEDPSAWLYGMGDAYDIGVRANIQALSPDQRQMVVDQLRQGFDMAMLQQSEEQAAQIREMGEQSIAQLEQVINDTDVLQFGFAIEPANQQLKFEIVSTAAAGTELAEIYQGTKSIPSMFSAVIQPNAAGYFHGATSISPKGIEQGKLSLEQATASIRNALDAGDMSEQERELLLQYVDRLIALGEETLAEGKSDVGGLLTIDGDKLNAVAGFFVSDGSKVAQLAKDLAAKVKEAPGDNKPTFTFDASTYKGVTMHYVEVDVPSGEEEVRQIFGSKLRLTIGTGEKAVYLAVGQQSEAMLKGLIDSAGSDSKRDRPLSQGQVRLLPILEFAQSIRASEPVAAMIDALARAENADAIAVISTSIERGSRSSLTIGEGILQAIGAAVAAQQAAAGAGQPF